MYVPNRNENEKPKATFDGFDPLRHSVRVRPGPQRRRQGRASASGCSSTGKHPAPPVHTTEDDDRLSPKRRDICTARRYPLFFSILSRQTRVRSSPGWPHITRGVSTTAPARQAAPGYGCTAAARRSPSFCDQGARADRYYRHAGRWAAGQAGPRSLAAGKLWEFLSLGGEGSSPRLLPIPFFKDSTRAACVWAWPGGGRSSPRFGHIWARTLVPRCQPSQLPIRGPFCPIARPRQHKRTPRCTKLGSDAGQVASHREAVCTQIQLKSCYLKTSLGFTSIISLVDIREHVPR